MSKFDCEKQAVSDCQSKPVVGEEPEKQQREQVAAENTKALVEKLQARLDEALRCNAELTTRAMQLIEERDAALTLRALAESNCCEFMRKYDAAMKELRETRNDLQAGGKQDESRYLSLLVGNLCLFTKTAPLVEESGRMCFRWYLSLSVRTEDGVSTTLLDDGKCITEKSARRAAFRSMNRHVKTMSQIVETWDQTKNAVLKSEVTAAIPTAGTKET